MRKLKILRVALSIALFLATTIFIADTSGMLPRHFAFLAKWQILPAVLSFSIGIILFWTIATYLFGRVYCSSLCPMGVFQDIFGRIGKMARKPKNARYHYSRPLNLLRYAILAAVVLCLIFGVSVIPALIDPYSAYTRMIVDLLQPLVGMSYNALTASAETIPPAIVAFSGFAGLAVGILTFVIVGILAFRNGRTFCNSVCPVGSALSIISRKSVFRMAIDSEKCIGCRRCEAVCKASCIDVKQHKIDTSRCVLCFDCLTACHDNAIAYRPILKTTPKQAAATDIERRRFAGIVCSAAIGGIVAKAQNAMNEIDKTAGNSGSPRSRAIAIIPPGAESRDSFLLRCTACQLCVSKCPQGILRPATSEYGLLHAFKPYLDYERSYCLYNCNLCSSVCPTGALRPLPLEEKRRHPVGKAIFLLENCVTQTDGVECGACARKCPVDAITMVGYGNTKIPKIDETACIGCGKCEYVCPASPEKAIYINGLEI